MSLFSVVPPTLFNPLASPGAPIYAEVLLALLEDAQRLHLPLSRELAHSITVECLTRPDALLLTAEIDERQEQPDAAVRMRGRLAGGPRLNVS